MKRKSLFYLFSLICGILFCYFIKMDYTFKAITLSVLAVFVLISLTNKLSEYTKYFVAFFFLGFFVTFINTKESKLDKYFDTKAIINAEILSKQVNSNAESYRYIIRIVSINGNKIVEKGILNSEKADLNIADVVEISGKISEIKPNSNPTLFNHKRFLLKDKVFSKIFSDDVKKVGRSEEFFLNLKYKFHSFVREVFDYSLGYDNSKIMSRVFLAQRIDVDFEENIREIGLSHILAVSGLHIGIVYLILNRILLLFPLRRIFREIFILIVIFLYGALIGNPASVVRAEVFLSVILLTKISFKITDNLNSLYLSILFILIVNPFMIFDIGLYLSSLSVFSIIKIFPYFYRKRDSIITQSFKLTFCILVMLTPIILYSFGEISLLIFLSNLFLVLHLCLQSYYHFAYCLSL